MLVWKAVKASKHCIYTWYVEETCNYIVNYRNTEKKEKEKYKKAYRIHIVRQAT